MAFATGASSTGVYHCNPFASNRGYPGDQSPACRDGTRCRHHSALNLLDASPRAIVCVEGRHREHTHEVVAAAVIVAFLAGPAFSQAPAPATVWRAGQGQVATEKQAEKDAERAYKRSLGISRAEDAGSLGQCPQRQFGEAGQRPRQGDKGVAQENQDRDEFELSMASSPAGHDRNADQIAFWNGVPASTGPTGSRCRTSCWRRSPRS